MEKVRRMSIRSSERKQCVRPAKMRLGGYEYRQRYEEGLKEGKEEGLKEGKEEGLKEGKEEG